MIARATKRCSKRDLEKAGQQALISNPYELPPFVFSDSRKANLGFLTLSPTNRSCYFMGPFCLLNHDQGRKGTSIEVKRQDLITFLSLGFGEKGGPPNRIMFAFYGHILEFQEIQVETVIIMNGAATM